MPTHPPKLVKTAGVGCRVSGASRVRIPDHDHDGKSKRELHRNLRARNLIMNLRRRQIRKSATESILLVRRRRMANVVSTSSAPQAEAEAALHAPIKWAQRADRVLLTVDLHDATDVSISFTDKSISFRGVSDKVPYKAELEFYESIDPEASTYKILPRSVQIVVMKKKDPANESKEDNGAKFWPHLLKDKHMEKNKYELTVDWNRWVDEDEEDETNVSGFDWANW